MSSLRIALRPFRTAVQSVGKAPTPGPGLRLFHLSRPHAAVYSNANKEVRVPAGIPEPLDFDLQN